MDKFELKEKLIEINDTIDKLVGELFAKGVADEELAEIRSKVYSALQKGSDVLKECIYNIY